MELGDQKPSLMEDLALALHAQGPQSWKPVGCFFLVKPDESPGSHKLTTQISFLNTCAKVIK